MDSLTTRACPLFFIPSLSTLCSDRPKSSLSNTARLTIGQPSPSNAILNQVLWSKKTESLRSFPTLRQIKFWGFMHWENTPKLSCEKQSLGYYTKRGNMQAKKYAKQHTENSISLNFDTLSYFEKIKNSFLLNFRLKIVLA